MLAEFILSSITNALCSILEIVAKLTAMLSFCSVMNNSKFFSEVVFLSACNVIRVYLPNKCMNALDLISAFYHM